MLGQMLLCLGLCGRARLTGPMRPCPKRARFGFAAISRPYGPARARARACRRNAAGMPECRRRARARERQTFRIDSNRDLLYGPAEAERRRQAHAAAAAAVADRGA